jgi:hypothetical protein
MEGLGIVPDAGAHGGVAHVRDGRLARQPLEVLGGEDLRHHAEVLVDVNAPTVDGADAAGILPPVLEGLQGHGRCRRRSLNADQPNESAHLRSPEA